MSLGSGEWSIVILIGQEKRTSHPKEDFLQNEKLETHTLRINKSYQRLHREDVITPPKILKSNRTIKMPQFLCDEMQDYLKMLYEPKEDERIFTISKSYLHHEMNRGSKISGVKRIRVHDLRHSHVSLLINMGFTVLAIADRMGHASIWRADSRRSRFSMDMPLVKYIKFLLRFQRDLIE